MTERAEAIKVGPGEGEAIRNPMGGPLTFKAWAEQTAGSVMAFESTVEPGEGPPLHVHNGEDEILYVLEGEVRFKLEDELSQGSAGTFVFVPRGTRHTWQNVGSGPSRLLVLFTPAGKMEGFFESFAKLDADANFPEAFARLGGEAGMDTVGPPLAVSDPL